MPLRPNSILGRLLLFNQQGNSNVAPNAQVITITGSSAGAQTNFVVPIDLTYDANYASDFSDINFYDNDDTTALSFWLRDVVDDTSATAYVLVPDIPASPSTKTIYLHHSEIGSPDGFATFQNFDDFNRVSLNNPATWTKYASNPLSGYGYGDPAYFYEGGRHYVFVDNLSTGDIDLFHHTDPEAPFASWTLVTGVLTKGSGGSWDDTRIRDPHVVKVGATYYMPYSGTDGSAASAHNIGLATSSSLTSGWSKVGTDGKIIDLASGVNEPTVYHDGSRWHMLMTYDDGGGTTDDVGVGDIYYSYNDGDVTDSTDWSTPTLVLNYASQYQDQEQIVDANGLFHMFVNDANGNIVQSLSHDHSNWGYGGNVAVLSKGGSYDTGGVYAQSVQWVAEDSEYRMYYQAQDGTGARIATATAPSLDTIGWYLFNTNFTIASNRMQKNGGAASWSRGQFMPPMLPPYVFEADLEFVSENDSGYIYGVYFAQDANYRYGVIFDPSANLIGLWRNTQPEGSHSTILSSTTSYAVDLSTAHKIRVIVTATSITVDWHDGTSWNTGILSQGSLTLIKAEGGFYTYATGSSNQFYVDNVLMRSYVNPMPSVSIS